MSVQSKQVKRNNGISAPTSELTKATASEEKTLHTTNLVKKEKPDRIQGATNPRKPLVSTKVSEYFTSKSINT